MKTCAEISPLLLPYELGACEAAEREACDAHVSGCAACLALFLRLKRLREGAAAFDERPAASVRDRLRRKVAARSRRRPLVFAAAAAALLIGVLAARAWLTRPQPLPVAVELVDSAPLSDDLL